MRGPVRLIDTGRIGAERERWLRMPLGFPCSDPRAVRLRLEASRRQMSPLELTTRLIEAVVEDDLFAALLDD